MGGKSSTQHERFLTRCLQIDNVRHFPNSKIFHQQITAKLPQNATEIVRFLKTYEILGFFEKVDEFFRKKTFSKSLKSGKFAVEYVSNAIYF